ncbi:hypothetical protein AK812_SmicGene5066 [Symbiodinium microadriaticum]|uniref:Uncharacterized protein n=1 Tax=Symbiodinium microadriaticum TaxID=2951 RepID=A0A1Q9EUR1_SYMMI|nr:hypothetical protein AK812_SmicGene5066 [Symbiodinium microadriaticum]
MFSISTGFPWSKDTWSGQFLLGSVDATGDGNDSLTKLLNVIRMMMMMMMMMVMMMAMMTMMMGLLLPLMLMAKNTMTMMTPLGDDGDDDDGGVRLHLQAWRWWKPVEPVFLPDMLKFYQHRWLLSDKLSVPVPAYYAD